MPKIGIRVSLELPQYEKLLNALMTQKELHNDKDEERRQRLQKKIDRIVDDGLDILHKLKLMNENT